MHKIYKIINILDHNLIPLIIITDDNLSNDQALMLVINAIKLIGRDDQSLGPLLNLTDGRDGHSGYKHSEKWKLENSKRNKGSRNPNFGKNISKEYGYKISKTLKGNIPVNRRKVNKLKMDGSFLEEYESLKYAALSVNSSGNSGRSRILKVCKGTKKSFKGYKWEYV
jgi:hypothetical protein